MITTLHAPLTQAFIGCLCFGPFALVATAGLVLWIWALVDLINNEPAEDRDRTMWILIVVLAGWIGALIYFLVRRPERIRRYGR